MRIKDQKVEAARLEELKRYQILDTLAEAPFDELTQILKKICQTKIALITFFDADRVWFKSNDGYGVQEVPRELAIYERFCDQNQGSLIEVSDLQVKNIFKGFPPLDDGTSIRYYAGAPLYSNNGNLLGSLCVLDNKPRELDSLQKEIMLRLSKEVMLLIELKEKKKSLKSYTEKLDFILEGSRQGTWEWDLEDDTVKFDGHWCRILGHKVDEVPSHYSSWKERVHPEDLNHVQEAIDLHLQGKTPMYECVHRLKNKLGEWVWTMARGKISERDSSGRPSKLSGTQLDITDRKKIEEENLFHKKELEQLGTSLNKFAIVAKTDIKGTITFVNDRFCEISKYRREELLGQNHSILNSGLHSRDFFKNLWKTLLSGKHWRGRIRNKGKDGSLYWVDTYITPIFENNKLKEFVSFRYEITAEMKNELLTSTISKLRGDYIKTGYRERDFHQCLFKNIMEITESRFSQIYHVNSQKSFSSHDNNFIDLDKIKHITGADPLLGRPIFKKTENDPFLQTVIVLPVYNLQKLIAILVVANSSFTYSAEEIRFLNPLLDVIGEMLYNIELHAEMKQLDKINKHNAKLASLGLLAAGVGHEINNPLSIAKGMLEMVTDDLKAQNPEKISERVQKIDQALERIEHIVKGLRAFSRSDCDDLENVNLNELIKDTHAMMNEIYHNEGIHFDINLPHGFEPIIYGSRGRIQQVLVNLITNGRDATEGREIRKIAVFCRKEGDEVVISVKDNGTGIPSHLLNKIFEPFFTTKEVNKGTGIGLSMVSSILKEHEGKIEVMSTVGEGSEFRITLPLSQKTLEMERQLIKSEAVPYYGRQLKVLIADDEEDLREILTGILEQMGLVVTAVENGKLAYECFQKEHFDLVISDMKMPVMDGAELLHAIRSHLDLKQPKFLFVTGGVEMEPNEWAILKSQTQGIIPKPFKKALIHQVIRDILSGQEEISKIA